MNLTKKFESNKEQIIEKIENMFNNFDICSIDCEHHQNHLDYYTVSVFTLNNNVSGSYLNRKHAKHVMDIDDYLNQPTDDDFISIDTDFIFYFHDDCMQLYMQCYNDLSNYTMRHLKTINTDTETEIISEIENLIK